MQTNCFETIQKKSPAFFLGANSGIGFYNGFDQIYRPVDGERLYIIKGGPGTGKSTLMKNLAVFMDQQGQPCELCYCSSDPDSLDGVRFPGVGVAVIDGTAPHCMDPKYVGISEQIVDVGCCLNGEKLRKNREEVLSLYHRNGEFHKKASRYLAAAAGLLDDSYSIDCEYSDLEKAEDTALRMCKDLLPPKDQPGYETKRFLSGITPRGSLLLENTMTHYAKTIVGIEDEYGGSSSVMMSVIRNTALEAGYSVITCPCALAPHRKIDHIIIPQAQLAFTTVNGYLPITVDTGRRIHGRRFRDMNRMTAKKQRLRFNRRAAEELMDGACDCIEQAKQVHDVLEQYYIDAMDFDRLQEIYQGVRSDLSALL